MLEGDLLRRAQRRVGTVLCGKYRIDGVLGIGGMAAVYAATHRNQKRVAVKMLHAELSIHQDLRSRFLREGYAANTVDHPGAVVVLDDDTAEDGSAFLVMERLEGEEIDRLWESQRNKRLAVRVVLAIASQLLDVLVAAHAKSIVHRDIKPSNLYITRDGTLKLLDFGIARVRDVAAGGGAATSTGMMLGTPAYMAPEQALGKSSEIDGTTDLWSVGATMFALLSGRFVHEGESATHLVVLAATQPARSLAIVAPDVDPRVVEIVNRAVAFEKRSRWPNAAVMRDAVRDVYLAMFGEKVDKEPLARLAVAVAAVESLGAASTMHVSSIAPLTPEPAAPPLLVSASAPGMPPVHDGSASQPSNTPVAQAASWPSPHRASGPGTTAQPVSSERDAEAPPTIPKNRTGVVLALLGVGAIAIAGVVWLGVARPWVSPAPASSVEPSSAPVRPIATPPAPTPTVSAIAPIDAGAAPSLKPPAPAVPIATSRPAIEKPIEKPAAKPAPPKPNCDPPYTLDHAGHHVPKPECM